ncbi:MAG: DUF917 domain-containing protein [Spirochaetota bacterium]
MPTLGVKDIEYLAIGAAVLGSGGGGDPYLGKLMAKEAIMEKGEVALIQPDDVPDQELVIPSAMMGAPAVMLEKLPNGKEPESAFKAVESFFGKEAYAVMSIEAGGINSCIPVYTAARLGLPLVDCDGMGRAFPEIPMVTFSLGGLSASPMVCCDEKGNKVVLETIDNDWVETLSRAVTVAMGLSSMIGLYVMDGSTLKKYCVRGTISLAMEIGRRILQSDRKNISRVHSILEVTGGFSLFEGKVTDVQRDLTTGFVRGKASFEGIESFKGSIFDLEFQNENLIGYIDGTPCVMVPDLITVLDRENGRPITTENFRYGQRVAIIGIPCDAKWRTEKGLAQVGPRYFKYDVDYRPIEELVKRSRK